MRKIFLFPLMLLIMGLAACTLMSKPDKTVTAFFQELKKGDFDRAQKHLSEPIFTKDMADEEKMLLKVYFGTMKVDNVTVTEQAELAATVTAELTAVDIFTVVQNFLMNMGTNLMSEGKSIDNLTDEQINTMLLNELKLPDAPKRSLKAEFTLIKKNNKWVINADNYLNAALFLQEYQGDAGYGDEGGFELVDVVNTKAVFTGGDEMQGICDFNVGNQPVKMYCEPEQMALLMEKYVNKEIEVVYKVYQVEMTDGAESASETLYELDSIIE